MSEVFLKIPRDNTRPGGDWSVVNATGDHAEGPVKPGRLAWLLERHAAALELFARQFCRAPDDVVQEAMIELAARAEAPDDEVAWLYGTVRYKAISAARRERRRKRREREAVAKRPAWFADLAQQKAEAQIAASALKTLPHAQREVIVAHIWGGLTFQQIGQVTGTSDSTAHRRYEAGLAAIRKSLRVPCPKKE